jgi:hypothetical protein
MISGINPNRFSSRPIHMDSKECADKEITIPDKRAEENKRLVGVALAKML